MQTFRIGEIDQHACEIRRVANGFIVLGPYDFQTNGVRDMQAARVFETFDGLIAFLRKHFVTEGVVAVRTTDYDKVATAIAKKQ